MPFEPQPMTSYMCRIVIISHLENVGIEDIMKIHKTHEYLWKRKLTWFSWSLGHAAMRNNR